MDRWRPGRALLALIVPMVLGAGLLGAQIAPTLPRDTLFGKLSPEANVPRTVIAPTLPRDSIAAGAASAPDAVRRDSIGPGTTHTSAAPAPRRRRAKPRPRRAGRT